MSHVINSYRLTYMYLIYLLISKKIHESLKKNIDWVLKDKLAFFVKNFALTLYFLYKIFQSSLNCTR